MTTYRIRHLMLALDSSVTPPSFLPVIFPNFDGSQAVRWEDGDTGKECYVTFDGPQTVAYNDPMVRVEVVD